MTRPAPLSIEQKRVLSKLEPALRICVESADLEKAKEITEKIQAILRPTGHETRLLQAKNWLYETALEAGNLTYAKMGFEGTIQKSSPRTRLHLEAVSLLAICYLRERNIKKARELIVKAVKNINHIKSDARRKQFHRRLITRLEEESILVAVVDEEKPKLVVEKVNVETIKLVTSKSQDQILLEMGKAVPKQAIEILTDVRDAYQLRLPAPDRKFLPPPLTEETKQELGRRASSVLKRIAWRSICSPDSEIYKAWNQGLSVVYDKKYIAGAIVAAFNSWNITITMLAASAAALAIKFGAEVFCETFAPRSMMIDRRDKI